MTDFATGSLIAILGTWLAAVVLPGPNFVATAHAAAAQSRRRGVLTAAGVACGTALWVAASLAGLGVMLQTTAWLHQTVKWAGACYLVWVGLQSLRQAARGPAADSDPRTAGTSLSDANASSPRQGHPFRRGMTVVLSNPKTAAFFTSLFAVAVPVDASMHFKAALAVGIVSISWAWYSFVACAVSVPHVSALLARAQRLMSAATGGLLVYFGLRLALDD